MPTEITLVLINLRKCLFHHITVTAAGMFSSGLHSVFPASMRRNAHVTNITPLERKDNIFTSKHLFQEHKWELCSHGATISPSHQTQIRAVSLQFFSWSLCVVQMKPFSPQLLPAGFVGRSLRSQYHCVTLDSASAVTVL